MNCTIINNLIKFSKRKLIEMILPQMELIEKQQEQIESLEIMIKTLQAEIQALRRDSSNSSKPPSSDLNNNSRKNQSLRQPSDKKSGGQKGRKGITRKQTDTPDEIISCRPTKCSSCGKSLEKQTGNLIARRQEIDIPPIKSIIAEYQQEEIVCSCGHHNKGTFPEHINAPMQIGKNLKSFIVYLSTSHHMPYKRLTQIMKDLLNMPLSEGTIENTLDCFHQQGISIYEQILSDIKSQKWTGSDETGTRVEGDTWWQWVWQNKIGSFYAIEQS
ncbi:MAG: transposase, partial [Nanoarchaeota archaeon]|nr:transposase [Nanoarchaeota archaeon]